MSKRKPSIVAMNGEVTIAILDAEALDRSLEATRLKALVAWQRVLEAEKLLYTNLPKSGLEYNIAKRGVRSARDRIIELKLMKPARRS
jgi:hypothetical protein